jgi:hypothetical protein
MPPPARERRSSVSSLALRMPVFSARTRSNNAGEEVARANDHQPRRESLTENDIINAKASHSLSVPYIYAGNRGTFPRLSRGVFAVAVGGVIRRLNILEGRDHVTSTAQVPQA